MNETKARRWYFANRPETLVDDTTFEMRVEPLPELEEGQFLLKTRYLSLDATNRVWLSEWDIYMNPVRIGEPMRGFIFGEIIASRHPGFAVGSHAAGLHTWSSHIVSDGTGFNIFPDIGGIDPAQTFAVLSVAGPTAHVGLFHIGQLRDGETVVVSGAAGAVGLMVGQIAKLHGARVIGIAGGAEKCRMICEDFGFDAAIDYRSEDVAMRIKSLAPDGIDLCFENVGGDILDASLANMKDFARVVVCGLISSYNASEPVPGPYLFRNIIMRRLSFHGFVILDHADLIPEALADLIQWLRDGLIKMPVHVVEGLENAPKALNLLYTSGNTGKLLVKVDDLQ